jgi:hypothetical protein
MGMRRETVDNTTEQSTLNELAHDAYLRLDVTSLDLARLPPHVNAELQTEARTFEAPALVSCAGDNPRPLGYEIPCAATARGQKHPRAARLNV